MKSIKLFIVAILMMFPYIIFAKDIDGIKCNYTIKCRNGYTEQANKIGNMQVVISKYDNYNNGNGFTKNSSIGFSVFAQKAGFDELKEVSPGGKIKDYYYKDDLDKRYQLPLYILQGDINGINFAKLYDSNNKCPVLYCNTSVNDGYYIEVASYQYNNANYSVETINATAEYLKDDSVGKWETREDFYSNDSSIKDSNKCTYNNIEIMGDYYDGGIKYEETVDVELITNYDKNGKEKSYDVVFNNLHLTTPIKYLDEDVNQILDGRMAIKISSNQLSKLFTKTCTSKIYVYLSDVSLGVFTYTITTSKEEVKNNIIDQNFDNKPGIGSKNDVDDNTDIIKDCDSLLGSPTIEGTPAWYLSFVFSIIRYVAIILLIVLTIIDFVSATASQDNDILKKATNKAIRRFVFCIIIFFLPTLLDVILQLIHKSSISDCIDINF